MIPLGLLCQAASHERQDHKRKGLLQTMIIAIVVLPLMGSITNYSAQLSGQVDEPGRGSGVESGCVVLSQAFDALTPLGRGQAQLITGPVGSGKTSMMMDVVLGQSKSGVMCVYAAVGQR